VPIFCHAQALGPTAEGACIRGKPIAIARKDVSMTAHRPYAEYLAALWHAHEDTVRLLLGSFALDETPLRVLARDLRPGMGGRWEGLPPPLEARRQLLLGDIARCLDGMGHYPDPEDLLPQAPDSPEGVWL
jgi:hypothetical protein